MNRLLSSLRLFLWLLTIAPSIVWANDDTPPTSKSKNSSKTPVLASTESKPIEKKVATDLELALARLNSQMSNSAAIDRMTDLHLEVSAAAAIGKADARKTMEFLDANPNRVLAEINYDDLLKVPIGIKETLSDNSEIMLGISEVKFYSDRADLTIFVRYKYTADNSSTESPDRDLFFGITGVPFSRQGGFKGSAPVSLSLLGDFPLPMKNWTVVLKGASNVGKVPDQTKTFVRFDCGKFDGLSVAADIIFPRSVIVPFDEITRTVKPAPERVRLKTYNGSSGIWVGKDGLRDMIIPLNVSGENNAFAVAGFEKFGFELQDVVIDLSDKKMGMTVDKFPATYAGDKDEKWRGLYIGSLKVLLPQEFKNRSGGGTVAPIGGVNAGVANVLIDRSGFTGKVFAEATGTSVLADCDAAKWRLTLKEINLGFIQNKLTSGGFSGGVSTPMTSDDDGSLFVYSATVNDQGDYSIAVVTSNVNVKFKCWPAQGTIYAGSKIELNVVGGEFYPSAYLSGEIKIGGKSTLAPTENPTYTPDETVDFKGLVFTGLSAKKNITTGKTEVGLDGMEYINSTNSKIANFPIVITKLSKVDNPDKPDEINVCMGLKVSVAEGKFSGTTNFFLKSEYVASTGKLKFTGFKLEELYISGTTTAMDLAGYIKLFDNDTDKGFDGQLEVTLKKPFAFGIKLEALFAYDKVDNYRYGKVYFEAGAPYKVNISPEGDISYVGASGSNLAVPIGIGDLGVNAVGFGVYFHMRPKMNGTNVIYEKWKDVPFGFKVMVGLQNKALPLPTPVKPTFLGRLNLDFSLSSTSGINSIALWGSGVFTSEYNTATVGTVKTDFAKSIGDMGPNPSDAELQNQNSKDHSQSGILTTAKTKQSPVDIAQKGDVAVAIGFMLDIPNKTMHAEAEVYVNTNVGGVKLIGVSNPSTPGLAGRAVVHIAGPSNGGFYVHLGNYEEKIALNIGGFAEASAYIMLGKGVPTTIPVDPDVAAFFKNRPTNEKPATMRDASSIATIKEGNGFAFGAKVKMYYDLDSWFAYVKGSATAGVDILLVNKLCNGKEKFRASGRLFGIITAKAGIYTPFGKKELYDGGLGVMLEAEGFAPAKFKGQVQYKYGREGREKYLNFGVSFGNSCS